MHKVPALNSEDDVRTKVVVPWLLSHGFDTQSLSIEFSFSIRLGRSISVVERGTVRRTTSRGLTKDSQHSLFSPRSDILVRDREGRNLLVIEVKGPDEVLDDNARDQGISYARLLSDGNIAPFVLLTNGADSLLFDSLTKERIDSQKVKTGGYTYTVGADDLALRTEALESMISISCSNMLAFCDAQTAHRMRPLTGNQIDSDKKYIPSLFVEREGARAEFLELLDIESRRVILLVGPPQVGKTNFVCQMVRDRLDAGHPTLFFPAISLRKSLLCEISEDFEWAFGNTEESATLLIRKIGYILRRLGKSLTIFIDGWNETNVQLARTIDTECGRLSCDYIQIVVSLTSTAATRLLTGPAGNPTFLADEAMLPSTAAQLIELDPEAVARSFGWSVVSFKKYSMDERDRAYAIYSAAFNVTVPESHKKVLEPYILGAAMKQFQDRTLPDTLDEPALLKYVLEKKIARAVGLEDFDVHVCLRELALEMYRSGAPVSNQTISKILSIPLVEKLPTGLFEAALLSRESDEFGNPSIDFYYGRERDFSIAYTAQNWVGKLKNSKDITSEFVNSIKTPAGSDALRWFLKHPMHIGLLRLVHGKLPNYDDSLLRRILLSSLCEMVNVNDEIDEELLRFAASHAMHDPDNLVKLEAVRLVALIADDVDDLSPILIEAKETLQDFVEAILGVGEEFPLHAKSVGRVAMNSLRSLHWDSAYPEDDTSEIVDILNDLSEHASVAIRQQALTCWGYAAPRTFLQYVADMIHAGNFTNNSARTTEFEDGLDHADQELAEGYYGGMCRGSLESICDDRESQKFEYLKMRDILCPIISVFANHPSSQSFENLLNDLSRGLELEESDDTRCHSHTSPDLFTLPLPFGD